MARNRRPIIRPLLSIAWCVYILSIAQESRCDTIIYPDESCILAYNIESSERRLLLCLPEPETQIEFHDIEHDPHSNMIYILSVDVDVDPAYRLTGRTYGAYKLHVYDLNSEKTTVIECCLESNPTFLFLPSCDVTPLYTGGGFLLRSNSLDTISLYEEGKFKQDLIKGVAVEDSNPYGWGLQISSSRESIYWFKEGTIYRTHLTSNETVNIYSSTSRFSWNLVVDHESIYWIETNSQFQIRRINGGQNSDHSSEVIANTDLPVTSFRLSPNHIYLSFGREGQISRVARHPSLDMDAIENVIEVSNPEKYPILCFALLD